VLGSLWLMASATWGWGGGVVLLSRKAGHVPFGYTPAFAIQLRKSRENLSQRSQAVRACSLRRPGCLSRAASAGLLGINQVTLRSALGRHKDLPVLVNLPVTDVPRCVSPSGTCKGDEGVAIGPHWPRIPAHRSIVRSSTHLAVGLPPSWGLLPWAFREETLVTCHCLLNRFFRLISSCRN
jgi:hypothetical protein